jgi:ubiquinone/menaquinone biosynthesis C-methylase UbiE
MINSSGKAMETLPEALQPDQISDRWDDHVGVYEAVFEPFTSAFAEAAIAHLALQPGDQVLDVGAGAGGATLLLAQRRMNVTAIDGSAGMIARLHERAAAEGLTVEAQVMDGQALTFPSASFDATLSVFGVILFPDAERGMLEIHRVLKPGGRAAIVTWTQPENYVLAATLREAMLSVWPDMPQSPLPAQLRFKDEPDFRALFTRAGFAKPRIETLTAMLRAPSARWLAELIGFAPGMAAMMSRLGERRSAVISAFIDRLEAARGTGELALPGVAFIGIAAKP